MSNQSEAEAKSDVQNLNVSTSSEPASATNGDVATDRTPHQTQGVTHATAKGPELPTVVDQPIAAQGNHSLRQSCRPGLLCLGDWF
jgi:hypothetical protein